MVEVVNGVEATRFVDTSKDLVVVSVEMCGLETESTDEVSKETAPLEETSAVRELEVKVPVELVEEVVGFTTPEWTKLAAESKA